MSDGYTINRMVDGLHSRDVHDWLEARMHNTVRIAATKTGEDKKGWLEDAAYLTAALALVDWTAAYKSDAN